MRVKRRASVEPIISHMKHDYRMKRNFLKGRQGDIINAVLSGAAFNFKRWLNLKLEEISGFIRNWLINLKIQSQNQLILIPSC